MPFDMTKLKGFYGMLLKIAMIITVVWGLLSFVAYAGGGGNVITYLGKSEFIMFITFLILEWTGFLILKGKFHPPTDVRPKQRPPTRAPVQQVPTQVPYQIEVDVCSICGKERPLSVLREFHDDYGYSIVVCEKCLNESTK